ncbi:hypothetical protein GBAR_LOCUS15355 [Geodia barretti]|uniref:Uncharacterized protein n=1 Tax=Geodia barretti TaxID=519541 RepID=A0AA35WND5_GEOBA|nr:hypothetical protein GBAR_LOCUS15355 [Geodia barretti]
MQITWVTHKQMTDNRDEANQGDPRTLECCVRRSLGIRTYCRCLN